jgi:hypothetical protein
LLTRSYAVGDRFARVPDTGALCKVKCEFFDAGIEIGYVERFERFADFLVEPTAVECRDLIVNDVAQERMREPVATRAMSVILNQSSGDCGFEVLHNYRDRDSKASREQRGREISSDHGRNC